MCLKTFVNLLFFLIINISMGYADTNVQCQDGVVLPAWSYEGELTKFEIVMRGMLYFIFMIYLFLGVSIISDKFMSSIEVITSQERQMVIRKDGVEQIIKVRVWNETVANLTLMALGSSAPEILLSAIEIVGKNFEAGELGPGTIVGSAAFNLFVIIAICVVVVPEGQVRKIKHLGVFFVTSGWAIFAYIWLYLIISFISPGVVLVWEALMTFGYFFATVFTAYVADKKLKLKKFKRFRLNRHNVIIAAESGEIEMEKEVEHEILEETSITDPHHFAIILRELKKRHSSASPEELQKLAVEEISKRKHKSRAFYRLQASKNITGIVQGPHLKKEASCEDKLSEKVSTGQEIRIFFKPDLYKVLENVGEFSVTVRREGVLGDTIMVQYATEDGTAIAGSDYEGATGNIVFKPGETEKSIFLKVIDDDIFEEEEHFYVHLTKACIMETDKPTKELQLLAEPSLATVIILDDDHCGIFSFPEASMEISESVGVFKLAVERSSGARGRITLPYRMEEGTAKAGRHYVETTGVIVFENNESRKEIEIEIVEENCYEKNVSFFVELLPPTEDGEDNFSERNENANDSNSQLDGKPTLGCINRVEIVIKESAEFKDTVNKLVEEGSTGGMSCSWADQFRNAFRVIADDDKSDEEGAKPTLFDYITHIITFPWKLIFVLVPPADIFSGYLCFFVSIVGIGALTAVIGDVASHFGCTVGLKDTVTAVTFVALGTSVPDTFASKVAAIQDSTADNSVGNVTGSNAVNVYLGIGIAWSIASIYHAINGTYFYVNPGNLAFCVTLFCTEAIVATGILLLRRTKAVGGELGGPVCIKYATGFTLFLLWIIYIVASILESYHYIEI